MLSRDPAVRSSVGDLLQEGQHTAIVTRGGSRGGGGRLGEGGVMGVRTPTPLFFLGGDPQNS